MRELVGSPICWIEAVKGTSAAVRYVTKYVTKAPAQFGNAKRYYVSKRWRIDPEPEKPTFVFDRRIMHVQRLKWRDVLQERLLGRYTWSQTEDGWTRFFKPGLNGERYGPL
jgi:hypothetical protein